MIPLKLTIQGIGPHAETEIDFTRLRSPIAVLASYGTGKTFLLECALICLFGKGAWYDSPYEALTQNGTGKASIELVFTHAGQTYKAARMIGDTGKTKSQRATLHDENGNMIAGPKVTDFERAISALIGDYETFLSTTFLSQNRRLDLCGTPGEEGLVLRRRNTFNALIGAEHLDAIEARCAEEMTRAKAQAEELEAQLLDAGNPTSEAESYRQQVKLAEDQRAGHRERLAVLQDELETAQKALRDSEGGDDVLHSQIDQHERAVRAVEDLQARIDALSTEIAELERRAAGLERAQADLARLNELHVRRTELSAQLERFNAWQTWETERARLAAAVESQERLVATLESVPGVDEATRTLAAKEFELLNLGVKAKEENEERFKRNQVRKDKRLRHTMKISGLTDRIEGTRKRLENNPALFGDKCQQCKAVQEFISLPDAIDEMERSLAEHQSALEAIEPDEELTDLSELRAQYEQAKAAGEKVRAAAQTRGQLLNANNALFRARADVDEHVKKCVDPIADPRAELRQVQADIDRLAGADERVLACERAAADATAKRIQRSMIETNLFSAVAVEVPLKITAELARATLANREQQRESLGATAARLSADVSQAQACVESSAAEIARYEALAESCDKRSADVDAKRRRAVGLRADIEALKDLRQCFGPRGVRQILIDNAAPELEAIADDLFERATGGRMRLRIATQSVRGDGSLAEDFQILVRDARGEREATRYSGGQLQLITILFRLAVSLWIGRLRGQRPECLFLDEAFDRLGADGAEDLLRVLDYLSDQIAMIVVVTHDPQIAARLRSQVRLSRRAAGVDVELVGVGA